MAYLMALDQGTSSTRTLIFDHTGQVVAMAQMALTQHFPQSGWVEHDPHEIWQHQLATMRQALAQAGCTALDLAAIGIANQRETVVLWDRASGQALGPALVWQDRRTQEFCASLKAQGQQEWIREATGLLLDPYFSASKIKWMLDHYPRARERALRGELAAGTIDSWLVWSLTREAGGSGLHVTDVSNASRTQLFNIHTGDWDERLLALFDVPRSLLPRVVASSEVVGQCEPGLIGAAVPIAAMAGDQQAALFGQGCLGAGQAKNTYGTGCFLLMHTGQTSQASTQGLLTTRAAQQSGSAAAFALEGSVFMGGATVQWLRDGLKIIQASDDIGPLAASVTDAGGVVMVPAFTGLGAPYWAPEAKGAILGMTRGTTNAHIARAALDSIALQTAALVDAMNQDVLATGGAPLTQMRVDGGACKNDLLMQIQADLLGVPVLRPKMTEVTAFGAASLAALAVGVYANAEEALGAWQLDRCFEPQITREQAQSQKQAWEKAVRQVLTP
jgi:glycerol kinase